jgi:hypothetical protein
MCAVEDQATRLSRSCKITWEVELARCIMNDEYYRSLAYDLYL